MSTIVTISARLEADVPFDVVRDFADMDPQDQAAYAAHVARQVGHAEVTSAPVTFLHHQLLAQMSAAVTGGLEDHPFWRAFTFPEPSIEGWEPSDLDALRRAVPWVDAVHTSVLVPA